MRLFGICRILKLECIKYVTHFEILKDCFLLRISVKKLSKLQREGKKLQKVNSLKSSTYINQVRFEYISEKHRVLRNLQCINSRSVPYDVMDYILARASWPW